MERAFVASHLAVCSTVQNGSFMWQVRVVAATDIAETDRSLLNLAGAAGGARPYVVASLGKVN